METAVWVLGSIYIVVWTGFAILKSDATDEAMRIQKQFLGDREAREKRLMDLTSAYMKKAESELQTFTERLHYIVGAEVSRAIKKQRKGR